MTRIVDRNRSGREVGFVAGVIAVTGFSTALVVSVFLLWRGVSASEADQATPVAPEVETELDVNQGGGSQVKPLPVAAPQPSSEPEGVIEKSSFESASDTAEMVYLDLVMLVQLELLDAEACFLISADQNKENYEIEEDQIYFGHPKNFEKPCVLQAKKVYDGIFPYQDIVQRGLTKDDPEYWPLMRKAAYAFVRALKSVCKVHEFDLVGEPGSIAREGQSVPDVTDIMILELKD